MTKKFLKEWGLISAADRDFNALMYSPRKLKLYQSWLDGGVRIARTKGRVEMKEGVNEVWWVFNTPARAVKFAAALNKLRRPLRLIKQDLDRDWAERVKERDNQTCALCVVQGDKVNRWHPDAHGTPLAQDQSPRLRASQHASGVTVHHAEQYPYPYENPAGLIWRRSHPRATRGVRAIVPFKRRTPPTEPASGAWLRGV